MLKYPPVIFILRRLTETIKKNLSGFSKMKNKKNAHQVDMYRFFFFLLDFFFSRRGDTEGLSELLTQGGNRGLSTRPGGCQTFMLSRFKFSPVSVLVLLLLLPAAFLRRRIWLAVGIFHQPITTAEADVDWRREIFYKAQLRLFPPSLLRCIHHTHVYFCCCCRSLSRRSCSLFSFSFSFRSDWKDDPST